MDDISIESQSVAHRPISSKPDPFIDIAYDSECKLYTASVLRVSYTAPTLEGAITGLLRMLGWITP